MSKQFVACIVSCSCLVDPPELSAGDSEEWEMAVDLNLKAPMLLTQAFAAGMVDRKVPHCIRIVSCLSKDCT